MAPIKMIIPAFLALALSATAAAVTDRFNVNANADADVNANANLGKRAPLLENRSRCLNPGWIPACPVGIPCIPPGGICCSDGIHYAMPPETCPEGTDPIATANPSAVSSPDSTLTWNSTPSPTVTITISIPEESSPSTSTSVYTPTPSTPSVQPSSTPACACSASVSFTNTPTQTPSASSLPIFTGAASSLRAGAVVASWSGILMWVVGMGVF